MVVPQLQVSCFFQLRLHYNFEQLCHPYNEREIIDIVKYISRAHTHTHVNKSFHLLWLGIVLKVYSVLAEAYLSVRRSGSKPSFLKQKLPSPLLLHDDISSFRLWGVYLFAIIHMPFKMKMNIKNKSLFVLDVLRCMFKAHDSHRTLADVLIMNTYR